MSFSESRVNMPDSSRLFETRVKDVINARLFQSIIPGVLRRRGRSWITRIE